MNVFKRNRINNNILDLINLQNLDIKKYNENIQNLSFKNSKFLKNLNYTQNNNYLIDSNRITSNNEIFSNVIKDIPSKDREKVKLINPSKTNKVKQIINTENNKISNSLSIPSIPSEKIDKSITDKQYEINNEIIYQYGKENNNIVNTEMDLSKQIHIKKDKEIKKAEEDFPLINVFSIFYSYIFCWTSKYQNRKFELIKKAKGKINYYL